MRGRGVDGDQKKASVAGWRTLVAAFALVALVVAACGDRGPTAGQTDANLGDAPASEPRLAGTVTVFAAASLTDAFGAVANAFQSAHPEVTVEVNFGPSSGLREQILSGAPADVYASANMSNMEQVIEAGAATSRPSVFAKNLIEIAVPGGNPAGIAGLADFANPDLFIGLCAAQVPCGSFGRQVLARANIEPSLDTNATDVRALLTQIASGDLDAGIVYKTDITAADGDVDGIEIPAQDNVVAPYLIAALTDAGDPALAEAFVAFVLSSSGQEILTSFGFDPR